MSCKWILYLALFFPVISFANEDAHTLGVGIGLGDYEVRDTSIGNYHIFYNYQFIQNWQAELNYSKTSTTLKLDSLSVNVKRLFNLSQHNDMYLKGGATLYDYDVTKGDFANLSDDGVGVTASIGWQYTMASNLGFYAEYSYADLGEIDSLVLNAGLSFSF